MSKVYIVMSDSYDDDYIYGVFSTKENAKKYIDNITEDDDSFFGDGEPIVIESNIDEHLDLINNNLKVFRVSMDSTGLIRTACKMNYDCKDKGFSFRKDVFIDKIILNNYVIASNIKEAIRITNIKRAQILGHNKWGIDNVNK